MIRFLNVSELILPGENSFSYFFISDTPLRYAVSPFGFSLRFESMFCLLIPESYDLLPYVFSQSTTFLPSKASALYVA